eukprot:TRINITY_DN48885_c0_g1_i2.p1 TRINITY_DN48885_c0_g1~~TRINITY_DN48885_c0_g1_i2.p1  ORF type:complete len:540 (-),score=116.48 TRINITY_DN48885_c0_g1_i2:266-1885(-)
MCIRDRSYPHDLDGASGPNQFDPQHRFQSIPDQTQEKPERRRHRRTCSHDYITPIPPSKITEGLHQGDTLPGAIRGDLNFDLEEDGEFDPSPSSAQGHKRDDSWGDPEDVDVPQLPGTLRFPSLPGRPNKLVVVMVGLPARGKSFIGRKVCRFLVWLGHKTRVFNVGEYRRELEQDYVGAEFFDPNNQQASDRRHRAADLALTDLIGWLKGGGQVALFDATNSTQDRRDWIVQRVHEHKFQVMFLESYCNDKKILENNITKHKIKSADYCHMEVQDAIRDFRVRLQHYEDQYETITRTDHSWVKIVNAGDQLVVNNIRGYIPGRLVSFLTNVHTSPRALYLVCCDPADRVQTASRWVEGFKGRLGGDSDLDPDSQQVALRLGGFMSKELPFEVHSRVAVWCSTSKRSVEMASAIGRTYMTWHALDELDYGICDGLTPAELGTKLQAGWAERRAVDTLHWRFPRGESVVDVINRLEPIFVECERQKQPVVIVSHVTPMQILLNFFGDGSPASSPDIAVPYGHVLKLLPHCYGCKIETIPL